MESRVTLNTPKAPTYLTQLCKHFGHKIAVERNADSARFTFQAGNAVVEALDGHLTLNAEAETDDALARLETILGSHLERFAFRENLQVVWPRTTEVPSSEQVA